MNKLEALQQILLKEDKAAYAEWLAPYGEKSDGTCRIAVVGELLRGKSTFVNDLLGENLLPAGVVPTNCTVTLEYGEQKQILDAEKRPLADVQLEDAVFDHSRLIVRAPNERLKKLNAAITEYPGIRKLQSDEDFLAQNELWACDGVILIMSAEQLLSITECNFIQYFCKYSSAKRILVWISKMDRVRSAEYQRIVDYARNKLEAQFPDVKWKIGRKQKMLPAEADILVEKEQMFPMVERWLQETRNAEPLSADEVLICLKKHLQEEYKAAEKNRDEAELRRMEQCKTWERQRDQILTDLDTAAVEFQQRSNAAKEQVKAAVYAGFEKMGEKLIRSYRSASDKEKWCRELQERWNRSLDEIARSVDQKADSTLQNDMMWLNTQLKNCQMKEAAFRLIIDPRNTPEFPEQKNYSRQKIVLPVGAAGAAVGVFGVMKLISAALDAFTASAAEYPDTALTAAAKILGDGALKVTALVLIIGMIAVALAEKALPGKEKEQGQKVETILKDSLRKIRNLTVDRAVEEIDTHYSDGAKVLNEEKELVKQQPLQVMTDDAAEKELKKAETLLRAVEEC